MTTSLKANRKDISLVFMGTPDFAAASLKALATVFDVRLCITQPDRPRGRGKKLLPSPVKEQALVLSIPVLTPEKLKDDGLTLSAIREANPDVIVVVAFGQMLPREILDLPKYGCINLHASLLPALRGAAPIQQAVIQGDLKSGNTTMLMNEGLDTGDILLTDEVAITPEMTYGELHDRLMERGPNLLIQTIDGLAGGEISPRPQPETGVSYVSKFGKQAAQIDFSKNTQEIVNLIRGMNPVPLAYTMADDVMVKILAAKPGDHAGTEEPGTILEQSKSGILVKTGDGAILIKKIQLPGKRPMEVRDFLNGNRFETVKFKRSAEK